MTKWELACGLFSQAEQTAENTWGVEMFLATANGMSESQKNIASANAEAQFDAAMREARKALDVARKAYYHNGEPA